mmetsp:Transcript_4717/g.7711  ORF Transcript_4717/g.7711 Transcript_4717/m.7711 type:complete len:256 (+) Transcript_4717:41-808(+)
MAAWMSRPFLSASAASGAEKPKSMILSTLLSVDNRSLARREVKAPDASAAGVIFFTTGATTLAISSGIASTVGAGSSSGLLTVGAESDDAAGAVAGVVGTCADRLIDNGGGTSGGGNGGFGSVASFTFFSSGWPESSKANICSKGTRWLGSIASLSKLFNRLLRATILTDLSGGADLSSPLGGCMSPVIAGRGAALGGDVGATGAVAGDVGAYGVLVGDAGAAGALVGDVGTTSSLVGDVGATSALALTDSGATT